MSSVTLFGLAGSVYVRSARLCLEEKSVPYQLSEVDVFAATGVPSEYLERHPFGRVPAFEHDGFRLYETSAITRYVDEAFEGPSLQPGVARDRARMNQVISILDHYAYRTWVWDVFVERIDVPRRGGATNEERIAQALPKAGTCLDALAEILGNAPWFAGPKLSLADLHAAPMLTFFSYTPEGASLLDLRPAVRDWLGRMSSRPSMVATRSIAETAALAARNQAR